MDKKLILEKAYENIISGIINALLPIIIPSAYSYLTKTPLKTIYELPFYIYLLLFVPLLFWIIRILIKAKMEECVEYYLPDYTTKYINYGHIVYKDIYWIIQIPKEYHGKSISIVKNHLNVSEEPKCNKCKTKLEFTKHDMWYTWKCVNCNFVKRTLIAPDRLYSRVEKKFERWLEIKEEEKKKFINILYIINTNFKTSYGEYELKLLQKLKDNILLNKELVNEIDKKNKDEIKSLFQKYYNKELKNKTKSNENFYNDIENNIELKNFLEEFLIDDIYEELKFVNLINHN